MQAKTVTLDEALAAARPIEDEEQRLTALLALFPTSIDADQGVLVREIRPCLLESLTAQLAKGDRETLLQTIVRTDFVCVTQKHR
jgi:hypothetical protein